MQTTSSKIWTQDAVSIYYNDIHYTTSTSIVVGSIIVVGVLTSCILLCVWFERQTDECATYSNLGTLQVLPSASFIFQLKATFPH